MVVIQKDNGIIITSTKLLKGSETLFHANGTQISANPYDTERLAHELILNIHDGIKETFRLYNIASDTKLGISQTVHTGNEITIGDTTYDVASANGQVFPKSWIIENEAEIMRIADNLNYDFDVGIERLNAVRVIDDFGTSKVVMDYADSPGVENFIEIDPSISLTASDEFHARSNAGEGCANPGSGSIYDDSAEWFMVYMYPNNDRCTHGVIDFDISSLPSAIVITDSTLTVQVDYASTSGK